MNARIMNILTGTMFALTGIVTLLEGVFNARSSNILIGICFAVVGGLYFIKLVGKKKKFK